MTVRRDISGRLWRQVMLLIPIGLATLCTVSRECAAQDFLDVPAEAGTADDEESWRTLLDIAQREEVMSELRLTNAQRQEIERISENLDGRLEELQKSLADQLDGLTSISERLQKRAELQAVERSRKEELRRQTNASVLQVLSDRQKQRLRERASDAGLELETAGAPAEEPEDENDSPVDSGASGESGESDASGSGGSLSSPGSGAASGLSERGEPIASFAPQVRGGVEDSSGRSTDSSTKTVPTGAAESTGSGPASEAASRNAAGAGVAAAVAATPGPVTRPPSLSFRFHEADWNDVLKLFAEAAGLTLNIRDEPPGDFTYYDDEKYTPTEALDIMNRYLLQDGYILVRHDRFLTVINTEQGIPPNLVETVSLEDLPGRGRTELLRVVLPLDDRDAEKTASEIRDLLGPQGRVSPLESASSLVVTDIGSNLLRVRELLQPPPKLADEQLTFQAFQLTHVPAEEAARMVRTLFNLQAGVTNVSAGQPGSSRSSSRGRGRSDPRAFFRSRFGGRGGGDDDDRGRGSSSDSDASGASSGNVSVAVDVRTNSVLVRAPHADMKIIEEAVQAVDVEQNGATDNVAARQLPNEPYLEVYQLTSADAREVAMTLGVLHTGKVVNEDGRSDRIHIWATPEEHREIAMHIRQLDGAASGDSLAIIALGSVDPYVAGSMVSSLYARDGQNGPALQIDPAGQNLIVRGTSNQVSQIRELLEQYGAGTRRSAGQFGPMRRYAVEEPETLARMIKRLWEGANPNRIEVLTDENRSPDSARPSLELIPERGNRSGYPDRGRRRSPQRSAPESTDTEEAEQPDRQDRSTRIRQTNSVEMLNASQVKLRGDRNGAGRPDTSDSDDGDPQGGSQTVNGAAAHQDKNASRKPSETRSTAGSEETVSAADRGHDQSPDLQDQSSDPEEKVSDPEDSSFDPDEPPIVVTVKDGQLVVASEDVAALDRLEQLIGSLSRPATPKTRWNVRFLRSADATETATLLAQLLPVGATADPVIGMSGFPPPPGSASQSLQIIPETRLNALFITGPPALVQDAEKFLNVLDSDELPESLRDRVPRSIPVEYANVNQVAGIVRDVYQDVIASSQPGRDRRSQNGNASNAGSGRSTPELTLGVDTRTSQLIVSSSDALYREIEELVASLDEAAYEAEQVVRVVPSGNGAVVAETLDALFPQVTISTTAAASGASDPGTRSAGEGDGRRSERGSSDADDQRTERIRRFMEMRRRFMQGGSGDGDSRGNGGSGRGRGGFGGRSGGGRGRGGSSRGR